MGFAQLTYRESLRDIENCLQALSGKLNHSGIKKAVSGSTLAEADESRDWRIYADYAQILMKEARRLYMDDSQFKVDIEEIAYALLGQALGSSINGSSATGTVTGSGGGGGFIIGPRPPEIANDAFKGIDPRIGSGARANTREGGFAGAYSGNAEIRFAYGSGEVYGNFAFSVRVSLRPRKWAPLVSASPVPWPAGWMPQTVLSHNNYLCPGKAREG